MANGSHELAIKITTNPKQAIDGFLSLTKSLRDSQNAFREAKDKVQALAQEISGAEQPTKKLVREYEQAQQAVKRLAQTIETQRSAIAQSKTSLASNGIDVSKLREEYKRLSAAADQAAKSQSAWAKLNAAGAQGSAAVAKIAQQAEWIRRLSQSAASTAPVAQSLDAINNQGKAAGQTVDRLNDRLRTMGHLGAAAFAALQAGSGARAFLDTVGAVQQLEARLRGLAGSADAYAREEAYLAALARDHHKDLLTLADGYTRVLSLERSGLVTREQARKVLEGLSNAQSALGASSTQLEQVLFGLGQALSSPVVRAEELNQVVEPLPGLLQRMDVAARLPAGGFRQLVNEGQVTSAFFRDVLIKALSDFEGAAASMGRTVPARFADIQNAYLELVKVLESPVSSAITPVLEGITERIHLVRRAVRDFQNDPSVRAFLAFKNQVFGFGEDQEAAIYQRDVQELVNRLLPKRDAGASGEDQRITDEKRKSALAGLDKYLESYRNKSEQLRDEIAKFKKLASEAGLSETDPKFMEGLKRIQEKFQERSPKTKASIANDPLEQARAAFAVQQAEFARQEAILDAQRDLELTKAGDNAEKKLAVERDFNERLSALKQQRIEAEIRQKQAETNLIADQGQRARALAEIRALEIQLAEARDLATLAADKLGAEEKQLADERAKARAEQVKAILAETPQGKAETQLGQEAALGEAFRQGQISLDQLNAGIDVIRQRFGQTADDLNQFAVQAARNMQSGFADFLFDPFQDGLNGMLKGFLDMIRQMVAQAAAAQLMTALFGEGVASGKQGAQLGGLVKMGFDFVAGLFHSGGVVGTGGAARQVPALAFVGAPRLHSGGWIKPGEVPAILMQGEEVLTADDPRHRNNFRPGGNVEVHVHEAPGTRATVETRQTDQGIRVDALIDLVKGAVQSDIAKGGDVARTMEQRYRLNPAAGATR